MQAKASQKQPSQEQKAVQAQSDFVGEKRSRLSGGVGLLLGLQRSHGNRFVQRFLDAAVLQRACGCSGPGCDCGKEVQGEEPDRSGLQRKSALFPAFIQAKLTVSQPGDPYEQEADRVADEVMRMPEPSLATNRVSSTQPPVISPYGGPGEIRQLDRQAGGDQPAPGEEESVDSLLSFKEMPGAAHAVGPDIEIQIQRIRGGGEPLSPDLRSFFEPRFGVDFSSVRIHTDPVAADTARRVQARAYTLGSDIAFAPGEFQKDSQESRKLLAHELTHVIQQGNQLRTVMRACDCSARGGSVPTDAKHKFLSGVFPNLKKDDYCVTAPESPTYNCIAWTVGDTSKWVWDEVDTYGNNNGTVEISDFDAFYKAKSGLKPVTGSTPADAKVALYAVGTKPTHGALKTGKGDCSFESKLGANVRIAHDPTELEGGSVYGDIDRYYV